MLRLYEIQLKIAEAQGVLGDYQRPAGCTARPSSWPA
jgi:hypothetical protein